MEPLASKLRPQNLNEFVGQRHILSPGKPLFEAIEHGRLHSMVLWGPPGVGKTTLARLMCEKASAHFETLSAVTSGVKDIREVVARAGKRLESDNQPTVLFVDEVHRFNKSQQDAFLPHIESGLLTFIGATTENPSFELNNALLSRVSVYVLKALSDEELLTLIERAEIASDISIEDKSLLIASCAGDGRTVLNFFSLCVELANAKQVSSIDSALIKEVIGHTVHTFDKGGEHFYDQISALHKSIRGSNPDAALFWCLSMLEGGVSPHYVLRRLVRAASEDIGNADPRALTITLDAWQAYDRLGDGEGFLVIAQAVIYLAVAPKSNAIYTAYNQALNTVKSLKHLEVPIHLRNAPTKLMKQLGYGREYRYAHDYDYAYVPGEQYFPDGIDETFYQPTDRGLEKKIKEKLARLLQLDKEQR